MNSNSSNERFDQIALTISNITARQQQTENEINNLRQLIESNARAIQANSESINAIAEASGRTLRSIELLREAQEEDRVNLQEYRERTDSLNAAVERLDTIIDYLINRDRP